MSTLYDYDAVRERAERLVKLEVYLCVSGLVWEIAKNYSERATVLGFDREDDFLDLISQTEHVYTCSHCGEEFRDPSDGEAFDQWFDHDGEEHQSAAGYSHEEEHHEAFEHWAVSEFFAEKLREHGEMVEDTNIGWIWGRCVTGQGIAMDAVVLEIAKELEDEYVALVQKGER